MQIEIVIFGINKNGGGLRGKGQHEQLDRASAAPWQCWQQPKVVPKMAQKEAQHKMTHQNKKKWQVVGLWTRKKEYFGPIKMWVTPWMFFVIRLFSWFGWKHRFFRGECSLLLQITASGRKLLNDKLIISSTFTLVSRPVWYDNAEIKVSEYSGLTEKKILWDIWNLFSFPFEVLIQIIRRNTGW